MKKTILEEDNEEVNQFVEIYRNEFIAASTDRYIDFDANQLIENCPKVYELLIENPDKVIKLIEQMIEGKCLSKIKVHFYNIQNSKEIHKIRGEDIGKLVSVKGIIKRVTKVIPRTIEISFECPACGAIITALQDKKEQIEPARCSCGRKGKFKQVSERVIDIQEINLEEIQDDLKGKQPQQIRVYIEEELTEESYSNRLRAGRKIEVVGEIKKLPAFMNVKDEISNISEFMIHANNIIPLEEEDNEAISEEDKKLIIEIAAGNPLKKLADNLSPEIYGNDTVKQALILQMIKGVPKLRTDGTYSKEDINVLLSGDVGIAKTKLLNAVTSKTPRAKMVVGTKTSRVGLGAMCVKDELTQTWSLEVGALVLCNGSLLAIDELDKMYKEHLSELLEPMASGTVSINRAGISACLPARTSILASANPIHGNYDLSQPLAKQIDLPTPIINRFDLIFILLDKANPEFDFNVVGHIFNSMTEKPTTEISVELFKKYIAYCRALTPQLKPELLQELQRFYVTIRQGSQVKESSEKGIPINIRNLEGLIRLAEAHAKLRLSDWVELKDLDVAKSIFMFCLKQIGIDNETGMIDTSRVYQKIPSSRRGKIDIVLSIIRELSQQTNNQTTFEDIKLRCLAKEIKQWEVWDFLEELKKMGTIFEPTKGVYSLV